MSPSLFKPLSGTFGPQLFENPPAGARRDLYWSVYFDFQPIDYFDEHLKPNCMLDWLTFPDPAQVFRSPFAVSDLTHPDGNTSVYFRGMHEFSDNWRFQFTPGPEPRFWQLDYNLAVDLADLDEIKTRVRIAGSTRLSFDGFTLVKSNLTPPVTSAEDAVARLREHDDLAGNNVVDDHGFKFVIHPV